MRRVRIIQRSVIVALLLTTLGAVPALAGGWAVVTLDSVPQAVQTGQQLSLGFMVRQHGITPIDAVTPILTARNAATGETLRAEARKEGPLGHFVVDFTAPVAGDWTWQIEPKPFGATTLGPLTVSPASAPSAVTASPFAGPLSALLGATFLRDGLRWSGILLLLLAVALGLWSQRAILFRREAAVR